MFRQTSCRLYQGLMQSKYVKYHRKNGAPDNAFWDIRTKLPVGRIRGNCIPQIADTCAPASSTLHPNVGLSGKRMSTRIGKQIKGRSAIRVLKPLSTREIDPLRTYFPYFNLSIKGDICKDKEPILTFQEKVLKIESDDVNSAFLMLVAGNHPTHKIRWLTAPHAVKKGDILTTTTTLTTPVEELKQGNSHPLGLLPIGTPVCLIETAYAMKTYKTGLENSFMKMNYRTTSHFKNAGSHAFITTQEVSAAGIPTTTYCYAPIAKRMYKFDAKSMAVVGRVSNPGYLKEMKERKTIDERWYLGKKVKGKRRSAPDLRYRRGTNGTDYHTFFKPITHGIKNFDETKIKSAPHIPTIDRYIAERTKMEKVNPAFLMPYTKGKFQ